MIIFVLYAATPTKHCPAPFAYPVFASDHVFLELMPEKVAPITGLRGMFRSVGGAFGISLITIILHSSSTPAAG
jgi:hypothetical protein